MKNNEESEGEREYTGYKFLTREMLSDYDSSSWEVGIWRTQEDAKKSNNGAACSIGLHLMRKPIPRYCPYALAFLAIGRGLLGNDEEKMRFRQVKLVRVLKFSEVFFPKADLRGANLSFVDLHSANLAGANLEDTYMPYANLVDAQLINANLCGAHLIHARLNASFLRNADLTNAELSGTNLRGADLTDASLKEARFLNADLIGADLRDADFTDAHYCKDKPELSAEQQKQAHC